MLHSWLRRPGGRLAILLVLILLASALRLWQLDLLPPGLYFDEAFNGLDARRVAAGEHFPIYFPENNGREPLFIYLQALAIAVLGATPYALRLVSALIGILTVAAVYLAARTILWTGASSDELGWTAQAAPVVAALVAAAGIAVSYWHLSLSRLGFRVVLLPLTSALAMAFFWHAWFRLRTYLSYAWSAVWFALAIYTYVAARLLPLVVVLFVSVELVIDLVQLRGGRLVWERWRPRLVGLAVMLLVSLLLLAPLIWELATSPGLLTARTADVSVFSAAQADMPGTPWQRIGQNILSTAGSFYVAGDPNPRHNLPGRPVNDPLLAILFTVGVLTALVQLKRPQARLLLIWLAVMLLPTILSIQAPHALRAAGALPPVALLYGLGAQSIGQWLARLGLRFRLTGQDSSEEEDRQSRASAIGLVLLTAVVLVSGVLTANDYFRRWATLPELGRAFDVDLQLAAEKTAEILADPGNHGLTLTSQLYIQPHMGFALGAVQAATTLPDVQAAQSKTRSGLPIMIDENPDLWQSMVLVARGRTALEAVRLEPMPQQVSLLANDAGSHAGSAAMLRSPIHQPGWPQVLVASLPGDTPLSPREIRYPLSLTFANGMQLLGYDVMPDRIPPGSNDPAYRLTLFWRPARAGEMSSDGQGEPRGAKEQRPVDVFAHLATRDAVWQTDNGPIQEAMLDSTMLTWEDVRRFAVPVEMPEGQAFFEVGLYHYDPALEGRAGERVPIVDDQGQAVADRVTLGGVATGAVPASPDMSDLRILGARFDDGIQLVGWRALPDPQDPSRLQVVLGWQVLDRPSTDYTSFVHLLDARGEIIAQHDAPPAGAANPTHLWVPGTSVRSSFPLQVPSGTEGGELRLRIGLYEPVSGTQLALASTDDSSAGRPGDTFVIVPLDLP